MNHVEKKEQKVVFRGLHGKIFYSAIEALLYDYAEIFSDVEYQIERIVKWEAFDHDKDEISREFEACKEKFFIMDRIGECIRRELAAKGGGRS